MGIEKFIEYPFFVCPSGKIINITKFIARGSAKLCSSRRKGIYHDVSVCDSVRTGCNEKYSG